MVYYLNVRLGESRKVKMKIEKERLAVCQEPPEYLLITSGESNDRYCRFYVTMSSILSLAGPRHIYHVSTPHAPQGPHATLLLPMLCSLDPYLLGSTMSITASLDLRVYRAHINYWE